MKKNSALISEIKNMSGNVLGIGDFDNKIVEKLDKNDNITTCNILGNSDYDGENSGRCKKMHLSKIRKFKHKKIDYLIVNYKDIDKFLKTFIKDSIYITKQNIYFCTNNSKILKLYNRYDVSIKTIKCSDENIYVIDTSKAKNNKVKEFIYRIEDYFEYLVDVITEMLVN